jgi:hypothetical protein
MVAAVHFFATPTDEKALLDYVLSSATARLFPWVSMDITNPIFLARSDLPNQSESRQCFGIVDHSLGTICFIEERPTKYAPNRAKAYVFDKMNWDIASPLEGQGIVDWNRTAALYWDRGTVTANGDLGVGSIGSQADAMDDISVDYRKWVNRVMNWVRRKSVKVAQNGQLTPEAAGLNLRIGCMNSVFALPDAMEYFHAGGGSREWG